MAAFKNKGWRFYDGVHNIFLVGLDGVAGNGAFMPLPSLDWDETEKDGDGDEYDYNVAAVVSRPQSSMMSSWSRRSTGSRPLPTQVPELPDLNHRFMLKELADAVEMYEDAVTLPPTLSVSSRSRKCNISQVSPSKQDLPGPQARSQFLSHGTRLVQQRCKSTPNSLHSSIQPSVASSSCPSKRTRANPGSGSGQMAVISGLSSTLHRIADVISDAQPSINKPTSPLLSAANIGPTDAIPLLQSDRELSSYLADLFMEKPDVL